MNRTTFLEYHSELDGYNYYLKGQRIYRFELWVRGIRPQDIFARRTKITFKERPKEPRI